MRLLRMFCTVACGSALAGGLAGAGETLPVTGVLRNQAGKALPGLTVRGFQRVVPGWRTIATKTRPDGTFSLNVSKDRWLIVADADELVARGYFCVPGWIGAPVPICGDVVELPIGVPASPLSCGQLGDPIIFEAVPTRPDLAVTKDPGKEPVVHLTYPWTTLPMLTIRQYAIEKSVDMDHWELVATVPLDGYGRVDLPVAGSALEPFCVFRAVEIPPLIIEVFEVTLPP